MGKSQRLKQGESKNLILDSLLICKNFDVKILTSNLLYALKLSIRIQIMSDIK